MSRPGQLTLSQVTAVFRLVREACELGDDPIAWRRHVVVELTRLLHTPFGECLVFPATFDPAAFRLLVNVIYTDDPAALAGWSRYVEQGNCTPDPNTPALMPMLHRFFTRVRTQ